MRWKIERAKKERREGWVGKGEMVTGSSRHVALWHRINMPNLGHYASHMSLWRFSHALMGRQSRRCSSRCSLEGVSRGANDTQTLSGIRKE